MRNKRVVIVLCCLALFALAGLIGLTVAGPEKDSVTGAYPEWYISVICIAQIFSMLFTGSLVFIFGREGWKKAKQEAEERDLYKIRNDL